MKIHKGDMVKIISGNDRGKSGLVIKVFPYKDRIIVEGINVVKKHMKPSQDNPQGGIIEKEMSIHISNIMLTIKDKPAKVGFEFDKNGKKYRINKQTNKKID